MGAYIIRRLLSLIPIVIGISLVVFFIMRLLPGDVAAMILSGGDERSAGMDPEALRRVREQLGLNEPLYAQYLSWMGGMLTLDAGDSFWSGRPVFVEIAERLPVTVELALLALGISVVIGIPIGILSALWQDSWADYLFRTFTIAGLALPGFWLGTMAILFLTVYFSWTPPLGYVGFFTDPIANIKQLFMPALVLGYGNAAIIARMTRSTMLEVMREDYIRTAWAKGLSPTSVLTVHALRNSMLPVLTLAAIELGHLLGGAVIMETIFTLPGIGRFLVHAIFHRDYPVVQAVIVLMGVVFVVLNLLVDLLYAALDPRIRYR